jgi:hypothetical protein
MYLYISIYRYLWRNEKYNLIAESKKKGREGNDSAETLKLKIKKKRKN